MSLFPSFSSSIDESTDKSHTSKEWLQNSSFQANIQSKTTSIEISESSDDEITIVNEVQHPVVDLNYSTNSEREKKAKKRKKQSDDKKNQSTPALYIENLLYEYKIGDATYSPGSVPIHIPRYTSIGVKYNDYEYSKIKKKSFKRYFHIKQKKNKNLKQDDIIKCKEANELDHYSWNINTEEEQIAKTEEFNKRLNENPKDVQLWLEFIAFQDTLTHSQEHNKHVSKNINKCTIEKKLSIVEKALETNSDNKELLQLKYRFMGELTPADQFIIDLEILINKDLGNILLWYTLISITQISVSLCTVPRVLEQYTKCFNALKRKRGITSNNTDNLYLSTLFRCMLFLRHAGLWEQMWEIMRLNLILNLGLNTSSFDFKSSIDEKKIIDMEEVILMSKLPLNQLWLRTEALRENSHWTSVSREELELVGDSRRFILPDDVSDFVHPLILRSSSLYIAVYSLLCLKIPLLPTRSNLLKKFRINEIEWSADSSEILIPFAYPTVGEMANHQLRRELLNGILEGQLTSGPQYLRYHPAQEPYIEFVRNVFHVVAESLSPLERTFIYVWWLRFERMLIFFNKNDPLQQNNREKKLRIILKKFLKRDENRNNLRFFQEYALIERELGSFNTCKKILETAIRSQNPRPSMITDLEERAAAFSLYRTYMEIMLDEDTFQMHQDLQIVDFMKFMVPLEDEKKDHVTAYDYLRNYVMEFLNEPAPSDCESVLLSSDLNCDIITCYAYLIYAMDTKKIVEVISLYDKCITHCENSPNLQELLYESQLAILELHTKRDTSTQVILERVVQHTLKVFPDNVYALSIHAIIAYKFPFWKIIINYNNMNLWMAFAICLLYRMKIDHHKKIQSIDFGAGAINSLLSFFHILENQYDKRHCPLLWRLHMLLLREHNLCEKEGEKVYHQSITHCPWSRNIYIDAAEVAPQLLTQIQDLLREKELRMHVTPEELEILRE